MSCMCLCAYVHSCVTIIKSLEEKIVYLLKEIKETALHKMKMRNKQNVLQALLLHQ